MKVHVVLMLAIAFAGQMASAAMYKGNSSEGECFISFVRSERGILIGTGRSHEHSVKSITKVINNTYSVIKGGRVIMDVTKFPRHGVITAMTFGGLDNPKLCTAKLSDLVAEN